MIRISLPEDCTVDVTHALGHIRSAQEDLQDIEQVTHDLEIAAEILQRLIEGGIK